MPGMPWPLPWPFDTTYMQLALIAGLAVGASAPLIGTFLVQKRLSLLGDGIGHVAVAGVGAGLLFGTSPVWTALVVAVAAALALAGCRDRGPVAVIRGPGAAVEVSLEVAATPAERERGLMYRTSLAEGRGMLFVFDADGNQSFWMMSREMNHTRRLLGALIVQESEKVQELLHA